MSRESVTVNPATKRLERDLAAYHADEAAKKMYHIEPENDNDIFKLKGYVYGPPDTPYRRHLPPHHDRSAAVPF